VFTAVTLMAVLYCPTCGKVFQAGPSPALPFCSPRCRLIDLNRWLNEEQRLPAPPREDDDETGDGEPPLSWDDDAG
jgi:endogenous inhibitor of DNA gyrase (YacG/DUF329 family)